MKAKLPASVLKSIIPKRSSHDVAIVLFTSGSEKDPKAIQLYRDNTADCCWTQDGITILSPSSTLVELSNESEEYNHLSYVLRVEYAGIKVILGGDASIEAWDEIYKHYKNEFLKADILLAPHHGSANNIHEEAFNAILPDYVIVSVAEGVDYDYQYYKRLAKKNPIHKALRNNAYRNKRRWQLPAYNSG